MVTIESNNRSAEGMEHHIAIARDIRAKILIKIQESITDTEYLGKQLKKYTKETKQHNNIQ